MDPERKNIEQKSIDWETALSKKERKKERKKKEREKEREGLNCKC